METSTSVVDNPANAESMSQDQKKVSLTGEVYSVFMHMGTKDWVNKGDITGNRLATYMLANLLFDVRLKQGVKSFANVETQYTSQDRITLYNLRELFMDFNVSDKYYFRAGKQVLQWGRCYLWNPTDMINVEKKPFVQKIGYREGAYGVRLHVPFGTKYNIYSFVDTGNATNTDKLAGTVKFEFLLGGTEMSVAAWGKDGYKTVYGYDYSSRFLGIDTSGEISASYGSNYDTTQIINNVVTKTRITDEWSPRASINFTKFFDYDNINDRISVTTEFYYNHSGYSENIVKDDTVYNYSIPVMLSGVSSLTGTRKEFVYYGGMYDPNSLSKYYAALFFTVNRFIVTDMSLSVNLISNMVDSTSVLSAGVSYKNLNDFMVSFLVNGYLGNDPGEYNFTGDVIMTRLSLGILF
jgi:hypothetical protein